MCGYWGCLLAAVANVSVIFPEPPWGIDRGWRDYQSCRVYLKSDAGCREMAEELFKRQFPALVYVWPACGKDDTAEAIRCAAVGDRGFVERYLAQLRRLCR